MERASGNARSALNTFFLVYRKRLLYLAGYCADRANLGALCAATAQILVNCYLFKLLAVAGRAGSVDMSDIFIPKVLYRTANGVRRRLAKFRKEPWT